MNRQIIPVGIFLNEIYLINLEGGKPVTGIDKEPIFDVLRPVSASDLENLRDEDEIKEYVRDLWMEAVRSGHYEGSLDDYTQEVIDESNMDDDEEDFPFKDSSYCEYLTDDLRKEADTYLDEHKDIEVGTWEASGTYPPTMKRARGTADGNHEWVNMFHGWDYIFNTPEAQKWAKEYEKEYALK